MTKRKQPKQRVKRKKGKVTTPPSATPLPVMLAAVQPPRAVQVPRRRSIPFVMWVGTAIAIIFGLPLGFHKEASKPAPFKITQVKVRVLKPIEDRIPQSEPVMRPCYFGCYSFFAPHR